MTGKLSLLKLSGKKHWLCSGLLVYPVNVRALDGLPGRWLWGHLFSRNRESIVKFLGNREQERCWEQETQLCRKHLFMISLEQGTLQLIHVSGSWELGTGGLPRGVPITLIQNTGTHRSTLKDV